MLVLYESVGATRRRDDAGGGVVQFFYDLPLDLLGAGGDDQKFIGGFRALDDRVADPARHQAVEHAQADGFVVMQHGAALAGHGVHKVRHRRDRRVEGEVDPKKVEQRVLFADIFCDDIQAGRRAVAAEHEPVDEAADRARDEGGEDGVDVLRVVLEGGEVEPLQQQKRARVHEAEHEGLDCEGAVDEEKGEHAQRYVDQQRKEADAERAVRHILDHRRDTVDAGGRKLVGCDEQLVVEREQTGERGDQQAIQSEVKRSFFVDHILPPPSL